MLSNLPPGVTGSEDVFGPKGTAFETRKCEASGEVHVYSAYIVEVLSKFKVEDARWLAYALKTQPFGIAEDVACPFEGPVEVEHWNDSLTWQCPLCETNHEEDLEDQEDW